MLRRQNRDLHVNHERWLVSYADFITLLFAFFVVMYSISQVNESKYRVLSTTLESAFKTPSKNILLSESTGDTPVLASSRQLIDLQGRTDDYANSLISLENAFRETFGDLIETGLMQVSSNELWLQIELRDSILFGSGSAEASAQAQQIFAEVSQLLAGLEHQVQIAGFTDNVPISNERFPSNWELSSARASALVKWMVEQGLKPSRLSAVGYAEHQPVASNDTAEGRALNRRVAIMIARHRMDRPVAPLDNWESAEEALVSPSVAEPEAEKAAIEAIELDSGELLYTSDPNPPGTQ